MEMGYVPANEGPVSNTLEYAYDDWCVAQMAKTLGKTEDYQYFMQRAQNYPQCFRSFYGVYQAKIFGRPLAGRFYPKSEQGEKDNFGFGSKDYVEANAWQLAGLFLTI